MVLAGIRFPNGPPVFRKELVMEYVCHSGGCPGSDIMWETEGLKYGVKTISYSFWNHNQIGKNRKILTVEELKEGFQHVLKANETLKRRPETQPQYVQNLLNRNWFQVKNSEALFAIGKFANKRIVDGGTGWAVQMAIDEGKPVFVFDQKENIWKKFSYDCDEFGQLYVIPKLTVNFAGVGTRDINENGRNAIIEIYKHNFSNRE